MADNSCYTVVRAQIEHIDNNLSQRIVWLIIAQSFFFSGYAILINGTPPTAKLKEIHNALEIIFPIASLLVVVFTLIDVIYSFGYMRDLRTFFEKESAAEEDNDEMIFPPIHGRENIRRGMHLSTIAIPVLFLITWIIIIAVQYV